MYSKSLYKALRFSFDADELPIDKIIDKICAILIIEGSIEEVEIIESQNLDLTKEQAELNYTFDFTKSEDLIQEKLRTYNAELESMGRENRDNLTIKVTSVLNKKLYLSYEIHQAFIAHEPNADLKQKSPSKRMEKIDEYRKAIESVKQKFLPICLNQNSTKYTEMDENKLEILSKFQQTSNQVGFTEKPTKDSFPFSLMDKDKNYLHYEFDRKLNDFIEICEWLENIFYASKMEVGLSKKVAGVDSDYKSNTSYKVNDDGSMVISIAADLPKEKILGKQANKNVNGFFKELVRIYKKFTMEEPTSTDIHNDYDQSKSRVDGKFIDFAEKCFKAYEVKITRKALHQKLESFRKNLDIIPSQ